MRIPPNKKILITILLFVVALITLGLYAGRHYYIKTYGIELMPSKKFQITTKEYYLQHDSRWRNDAIGMSNSTMRSAGCLIACVASSLNSFDIQITPGLLNSKLTEAKAYANDLLIWHKLNKIFPKIDYKYSRIFTSNTIDKDLEAGLLPIVNVKYKRNGVTHWVIIVGAENGDYMIYDPFNTELKPIPLSVHGKVYAYRVLILK